MFILYSYISRGEETVHGLELFENITNSLEIVEKTDQPKRWGAFVTDEGVRFYYKSLAG